MLPRCPRRLLRPGRRTTPLPRLPSRPLASQASRPAFPAACPPFTPSLLGAFDLAVWSLASPSPIACAPWPGRGRGARAPRAATLARPPPPPPPLRPRAALTLTATLSAPPPPLLPAPSPHNSHTIFFSVYRGSIENQKGAAKTGLLALAQPLLVTAIPTVAYAAYYRGMPPQAMRFGLLSCVLLHLYDRVIHPKGLMTEVMPMARLNRVRARCSLRSLPPRVPWPADAHLLSSLPHSLFFVCFFPAQRVW